MVVGITGGIGSGKSTVAKMFAEYDNVVVYFADLEAKNLMNSSSVIKKALITEFSEQVYQKGQLNRAFLAEIVFNNKEKLAKLNSIVHPQVHLRLKSFIAANSEKDYILYENAILFENGSDSFCDKIITVTAPKPIRIARVVQRDQTTEQAVKRRMKNQWTDQKKCIQSHYIINNLNLEDTKLQVNEIHKKLTQ